MAPALFFPFFFKINNSRKFLAGKTDMFLFSSDINHLPTFGTDTCESHGTCRDANISQLGHYNNERPIHLVCFFYEFW